MTVFFVNWDTMVTLKTFLFTMGNRPDLVERGLSVVGFTCNMCIKGLEVNYAARLTIRFGTNKQSVEPCDRFAHGNRLKYSKPSVLI